MVSPFALFIVNEMYVSCVIFFVRRNHMSHFVALRSNLLDSDVCKVLVVISRFWTMNSSNDDGDE